MIKTYNLNIWRDARAQIERLEKAIAGPSGEVESEAGGEGGN